jgi:hypothetical protein
MNILQGKQNWKLIILTILFISTLWVSCSNSNSNADIYKPELSSLEDIQQEEIKLYNLLKESKQIMDTTTKEDIFLKAKTQFDIAKDGYEYIYEFVTNKNTAETYSIKSIKALSTLSDSIFMKRQALSKSSFVFNQIEKESIALLLNFNLLKNELGLSDSKKFDIYSSFDIVDSNIERYENIRKAYDVIKSISNKDDIAYYSENVNRYQIVFICANLEDIITIRSFVEKSNDFYLNRKDKNYVNANKSNLQNLTKQYTQIGNRKELCGIYMPGETRKLPKLERFALAL